MDAGMVPPGRVFRQTGIDFIKNIVGLLFTAIPSAFTAAGIHVNDFVRDDFTPETIYRPGPRRLQTCLKLLNCYPNT